MMLPRPQQQQQLGFMIGNVIDDYNSNNSNSGGNVTGDALSASGQGLGSEGKGSDVAGADVTGQGQGPAQGSDAMDLS